MQTRIAAITRPVVPTADRHATWACDLRPDFGRADTPAVAAEITGTSDLHRRRCLPALTVGSG